MTDANEHNQIRAAQDRPMLPSGIAESGKDRYWGGDVSAEHEHEQAAYIERLEDQAQHAADAAAGRSADDALAELITDLDATAPDPYPGDEAHQAQLARDAGEALSDPLQEALRDRDVAVAQLLHEMLFAEGPPVPPGQAAEFAAYAEMWAQEALADYDRDLDQRAEHDQSAEGRTHSGYNGADEQQAGSSANSAAPVTDAVDLTGTDGNEPPGKPQAADAVDAAHAAAAASARALDDRENRYTLPVVHRSGAEAAAAAIAADARENTYTQHGRVPMTRAVQNQLLAQGTRGEKSPGTPVAADTVDRGDDRNADSWLDALAGPAPRSSWVDGKPPHTYAGVVIDAAEGAVHHAHRAVDETQTRDPADRAEPVSQCEANATSHAGEVLGDE
ncbi:MAG: hypothetical protein ACRDRY_07195 [Pseudonocardiaceae bacterium]